MKNIIKKGFSLVELLIVVAIIGILTGVALVGYNSYVDSAKDSVNEANATQLARKIIIEKAKPFDFKTNTYEANNNACDATSVPKSWVSNEALANAAACYAKLNFTNVNLETTLTFIPAAGYMSVGTDAKVYWTNMSGVVQPAK